MRVNRHPYGVLHPFSIKNIFYDKNRLKAFLKVFWSFLGSLT